jgi:hypothetical protein
MKSPFLEALKNGQITREEVNSEVPWQVTLLIEGPSIDFILGRIFEAAMRDAYDEVVKRDNNGMPLQTSVNDDGLRRMIASTKYSSNNCTLIR